MERGAARAHLPLREPLEPDPSTGPPSEVSNFTAFSDTEELIQAVDAYVEDGASTTEVALTYGWPMGKWDVSKIHNFSSLFSSERNNAIASRFNEDLSPWDTSSVTDMSYMFSWCRCLQWRLVGLGYLKCHRYELHVF